MRLDRIYCRPCEALLRSFVDRSARDISDHLPVIGDVALDAVSSGMKGNGNAAPLSMDRVTPR